ncbi:MAG TPA: YwqG family protein [Ktedonobacterales bacterium]|nr:YwqG family protein [Ktedonobacterales bacterium]
MHLDNRGSEAEYAKVVDLIRAAGIPRIAHEIEGLIRPSIRMRTFSVSECELEVGHSKIGGLPDLPPYLSWPTWQGMPLAFIAQINLAEVAEYDRAQELSRSGILYFFYDAEQRASGLDTSECEGWRVLYFPHDISHVSPAAPPTEVLPLGPYTPCGVTFSSELTLPTMESEHLTNLGLDWETMYSRERGTPEIKREGENYLSLHEQVGKLYGESGLIHRLLGYPDPIQNDVQLDCQFASHNLLSDRAAWSDEARGALREGATDWCLLLQVDSDDAAGMMWGDVGRLYYMMPRRALAQRDFSQVWLIMQCC